MLGLASTEMVPCESWDWVPIELISALKDPAAAVQLNGNLVFDSRSFSIDGTSLHTEVQSRLVRVPGYGELVVSALRDTTARAAFNETMRHLAFHDTLTGLGNRVLLEDRLQQAIAGSDRHGDAVGIVYMDLDDFKPVNDSMGHATGDRVLRIIADRLKQCMRESDTIVRMGGDEFVALFPRLAQYADLAIAAQSIAVAVGAPIVVDGVILQISVSVGLATYSPGEAIDELITRADHAMYRAKLNGVLGWEEFLAR
jgi:diguanylate cyclase (GGDEF)-like protein